ncbi:MAG TPA: hypothetical protein VGX25_17430 [Actinophytocola sp.]|uniref:hypothetical protein n=1 Tax=Actinophytocola sp. TaxID=1872138 RepID=UPI002DDD8F42|nr:hypothetical protein [Actinophytocola sp.]HEV2781169.1 hypothetical protein [Actinophytocola sp.]
MVVLAELVKELKALRKGRGVFASGIGERVGPALREVCNIAEDDGPAMIRQKVIQRLEGLAANLPSDLRTAVLAAFAIYSDARLPLYQDRVSWAASRLNRDPRTARRRIDEGINHLAQLATIRAAAPPPPGSSPAAENGWHTTQLRVMLALDRERPEAIEQRRIVSDQGELAELDLAVTLPVPPGLFDAHVFYGGTLIDRGMESRERHAFGLALPRTLTRGERHEFAIHFRLPEGLAMPPYFVCVPKRPCELFDLRVRFDRKHLPTRIELLHGVFQRDASDLTWTGATQSADEAGEVHLTFLNLTPGLSYGLRWVP